MRKRFTNASIHRRGNTVVVTARLPTEVVEVMDAAIGKEGLPDRSAVIQDACSLWCMFEERESQ